MLVILVIALLLSGHDAFVSPMHKFLYAVAASLVAVESSPPRLMAMFGAEGPVADDGKSKETTTTRAPQRLGVVHDAPPPLKWRHQPYALPRTVNGTGHTGPSWFCATSS